jgi:Na+/H+ antiporter NhaD/arsenite permease-like protein
MTISETFIVTAWVIGQTLLLQRARLTWAWAAGLAVGGAVAYAGLRLAGLPEPAAAATAVFLLAYALIATEKIHKTTVALAGAMAMVLVRLITQREALHGVGEIEGVDWNTIFLLIGMMVIVNVTRQTGAFEWLAIRAAKIARGEPVAVLILLSVVTAVVSAGLDNVTTVLLIAPVTIFIARALRCDPVPFLICIVLASNIGGTATLVGDPPNIMIASSAHLTFPDFLRLNGPVVIPILAVFCLTAWLYMRKRLTVSAEHRAEVMALDEHQSITDKALLWRCLAVIGLVLVGFTAHGMLRLEPATIALAGAALLLLIHHEGPEEALRDVEWTTIFFFVGLFIMVAALVKTGVIGLLGQGILSVTHGNPAAMTMLVLWFSAIASGIVDNIPFVATMTALIHGMARSLHPEATSFLAAAHAPDVYPLWWALSLGACLGGNFTLIGASANVVVAGLADREECPITFARFLKYGVPLTLQALAFSSLWLWFIFLR